PAEVLHELGERDAAGDGDGLGRRAHRSGHEAGAGERLRGLASHAGGRLVDLLGLRAQAVLVEHERGAAEGVGLDDVRPRGEVGRVDVADDVGPGEDEVLVAPFEVRSAEVLRGEVALLDHRPHRAVDHEDALGEQADEVLGAGAEREAGVVHLDFFPLATMTWKGSPRLLAPISNWRSRRPASFIIFRSESSSKPIHLSPSFFTHSSLWDLRSSRRSVPPGARTRAASRIALAGSFAWCSAWERRATSTEASSRGRSSISPFRNERLRISRAWASALAPSRTRSETSTATT